MLVVERARGIGDEWAFCGSAVTERVRGSCFLEPFDVAWTIQAAQNIYVCPFLTMDLYSNDASLHLEHCCNKSIQG